MTIKECKAKERQLAEQESLAKEKLEASMKELARKILADVKIRLEENDEEDINSITIRFVTEQYRGARGVTIQGNEFRFQWDFTSEELENE